MKTADNTTENKVFSEIFGGDDNGSDFNEISIEEQSDDIVGDHDHDDVGQHDHNGHNSSPLPGVDTEDTVVTVEDQQEPELQRSGTCDFASAYHCDWTKDFHEPQDCSLMPVK